MGGAPAAAAWLKDYRFIEEAGGARDASGWGLLRVLGPDCRKFLHGLLTNDVLGLKPWSGFSCCLLTPKGKLDAEFLLYDAGEGLLALGVRASIARLAQALSKFLVLSQSRLEPLGEGYSPFFIIGPKAPEALNKLFGVQGALSPYEARAAAWRGAEVLILSDPRLRADAFWLCVQGGGREDLRRSLLDSGVSPVAGEALEALRIERGVPLFGQDLGTDTIPLEARLEPAISFTKGCYMGQETISRIKHMGHVNRLLCGMRLSGEALPGRGAGIFAAEKEVGALTSVSVSPRLGAALALAMVRVEESRPGARLRVEDSGREWRAEVVSLPV